MWHRHVWEKWVSYTVGGRPNSAVLYQTKTCTECGRVKKRNT